MIRKQTGTTASKREYTSFPFTFFFFGFPLTLFHQVYKQTVQSILTLCMRITEYFGTSTL